MIAGAPIAGLPIAGEIGSPPSGVAVLKDAVHLATTTDRGSTGHTVISVEDIVETVGYRASIGAAVLAFRETIGAAGDRPSNATINIEEQVWVDIVGRRVSAAAVEIFTVETATVEGGRASETSFVVVITDRLGINGDITTAGGVTVETVEQVEATGHIETFGGVTTNVTDALVGVGRHAAQTGITLVDHSFATIMGGRDSTASFGVLTTDKVVWFGTATPDAALGVWRTKTYDFVNVAGTRQSQGATQVTVNDHANTTTYRGSTGRTIIGDTATISVEGGRVSTATYKLTVLDTVHTVGARGSVGGFTPDSADRVVWRGTAVLDGRNGFYRLTSVEHVGWAGHTTTRGGVTLSLTDHIDLLSARNSAGRWLLEANINTVIHGGRPSVGAVKLHVYDQINWGELGWTPDECRMVIVPPENRVATVSGVWRIAVVTPDNRVVVVQCEVCDGHCAGLC